MCFQAISTLKHTHTHRHSDHAYTQIHTNTHTQDGIVVNVTSSQAHALLASPPAPVLQVMYDWSVLLVFLYEKYGMLEYVMLSQA